MCPGWLADRQNRQQQPKRRHRLRKPLAAPCAHMRRELQKRQFKHGMRQQVFRRCRLRSARHNKAQRRRAAFRFDSSMTKLTAGLKCAPEIGPNTEIRTISAAAVAIVLHNSASAISSVRLSAMMPEPTTAATRRQVPANSAVRRRARFSMRSVLHPADFIETAFQSDLVKAGDRQRNER